MSIFGFKVYFQTNMSAFANMFFELLSHILFLPQITKSVQTNVPSEKCSKEGC